MMIQFDVAGIETKVTNAKHYHDQAEERNKHAEYLFEKRDNEMKPSIKEVKKWGQFLKQIYKDNPRELGNWGICCR